MGLADVLAATVGVHDQPWLGLAQGDGHLQGRVSDFLCSGDGGLR
jgi:hypothetical protein